MKLAIEPSRKTDWLIIFLVLDTIDLTNYLDELLSEVKSTRLREKTKVYFLIDSIQRIENPAEFPLYQLEVTQLLYNNQTRLTERKPIQLREVNKNDGYAWLEAIRQIYKENPASFRMLIPWSHATAISIKSARELSPVYKTKYNLIRNYRQRNKLFNLEQVDCGQAKMVDNAVEIERTDKPASCLEPEQLFISELADGLAEITKNDKFDMVVMSNCYTQMIDNCYNLRQVTKYYIAPITLVSLSVFDFGAFINSINKTSWNSGWKKLVFGCIGWLLNINKRLLGGRLYKTYSRQVIQQLLAGFVAMDPGHGKGAAIIANELDAMDGLKPLLNAISDYLIDNRESVYPKIVTILTDPNIIFTTKDYLDLIVLFNEMDAAIKNEVFSAHYRRLKQFLANIRVDRVVGSDFTPDQFNYCSIYIPINPHHDIELAFCCQYFRKYFDSAFVRDMTWDNFVVDFTNWRSTAH